MLGDATSALPSTVGLLLALASATAVNGDCSSADDISSLPSPQTCIDHGGLQRCWYTFAPEGLPSSPAVVFNMHGHGQCATDLAYMGWRTLAAEHKFILALPMGTEDPKADWNAGRCCSAASQDNIDDVGFLRRVATSLQSSHGVDLTRVYFAGHSNGCMMSQRMAYDASDLVAAVSCSSGYLMATPTPGRETGLVGGSFSDISVPSTYVPVPVLTVHGTEDSVVPWDPSMCSHSSEASRTRT